MEPFNAPALKLLDLNEWDVFTGMITAFVLTMILAKVSAFTNKRTAAYTNPSLSHTMILLSTVVSLIMAVIGNSLARAFGAIGALSLIRFRTAIKEPIDLAKLFMSISIGMASGSGYPQIAMGAAALYCVFLAVIQFVAPSVNATKICLVKLEFTPQDKYEKKLRKTLEKHTEAFNILTQNLNTEENQCQLILELTLPVKSELDTIFTEIGEFLPEHKAHIIKAC